MVAINSNWHLRDLASVYTRELEKSETRTDKLPQVPLIITTFLVTRDQAKRQRHASRKAKLTSARHQFNTLLADFRFPLPNVAPFLPHCDAGA